MNTAKCTAIMLACVLTACAESPEPSEPPEPVRVMDVDGHGHYPERVADGNVHVIIATSHECPIANAYAPTIKELYDSWAGQPVTLFLVHVDADLTPAAAKAHQADYSLPGTILLDPQQQLVKALEITKTPEAVVLRADGVAYRGRIDDQWRALGSRANSAASHDLRDAVAAALAGKSVPLPYPEAVGCLLPTPEEE